MPSKRSNVKVHCKTQSLIWSVANHRTTPAGGLEPLLDNHDRDIENIYFNAENIKVGFTRATPFSQPLCTVVKVYHRVSANHPPISYTVRRNWLVLI